MKPPDIVSHRICSLQGIGAEYVFFPHTFGVLVDGRHQLVTRPPRSQEDNRCEWVKCASGPPRDLSFFFLSCDASAASEVFTLLIDPVI